MFFECPGVTDTIRGEIMELGRLGVWCFTGFASLFPLVFASIYWRRVTRAGAIASVLVAAVAWCYLFFVESSRRGLDLAEDYLIAGMMPVAIMVTVSAVTLIVVSLMTTPPPSSLVDRFFDLKSPSACNPQSSESPAV